MKICSLPNGTDIAYLDEGEGPCVLLIHGFASNAAVNWVGPGWVDTLVNAGYRVIALDNRGHGSSSKYYDEAAYRLSEMASDASSLIDALELVQPHVMGYSLGARISATLAAERGEDLGKVVLAGSGYNMVEGGFDSTEIRDGLLANDLASTTTEIGRNFRFFAEQTGSDLKALAACIMGGRSNIDILVFHSIPNDTLVMIGEEDTVAFDGEKLATIIPKGRFKPIPKRNHMNAVGDKVYKSEVLAFLSN